MKVSSYAAIVIGSKNMLMKVYEITDKKIRTLDEIRYEYELGKEAYITRKITFTHIEKICEVLSEFQLKLKEYGVDVYKCYATSAIRNAKNQVSVLNQIKIRTGIDVIMLSNSELRFLMYKGIQILDLDFNGIIEKNTAILDIGAGSVQVSLFDKQALYVTQNLDIGTVKVRELLESVENNVLDYISVMEEYIQYEFDMFKSVYLKEKEIKNVIAIGDEIKNINRLVPELHLTDTMNYEQVQYIFRKIRKSSYKDLAIKYGLSIEDARMTLPSLLIYKTFLERSKADTIYICATNLCDGSVVDYAEEEKKIPMSHDFYQDIVASAKYIGKRYRYNKVHAQYITKLALEIFDKTKTFHGLGKRDRLVLEIASILHDIGKYVNLNDPGKNAYQLIMSTEIMGLSHTEREEVANVVLYNTQELPDTDELDTAFWRMEYLKIAKLTAILRLANALDRGHKQKFEKSSMTRKGKNLIITLETNQDITLENNRFRKKAEMFAEFTGITPILKQKKVL
ncbi:MAG: HD domain-containing protein [Eubacterium sp.]|nr:HD domain-containing protein [Eubacterium sp.]MDD7209196.1 HD domain-containing protein [Lachnospiraceae bacterium]MDY5497063.1 exopolyphosphatase [Anaerobutyricum sp.]